MAVIRPCSININKSVGWTSRDILNKLQSIYGYKKFGHAGTLDPLATGVLVVLVGDECKKQDYYMGQDKTYVARIFFGVSSVTNDLEGPLETCLPFTTTAEEFKNSANEYLQSIKGDFKQAVPYFSAVKVNGKELYKSSRQGELVKDLPVKTVKLIDYEILQLNIAKQQNTNIDTKYLQQLNLRSDNLENDYNKRLEYLSSNFTYIDLRLDTSKGFYVRSLARDLGERLNTCAVLGSLQRTKVGHLNIKDSKTIEDFSKKPDLV